MKESRVSNCGGVVVCVSKMIKCVCFGGIGCVIVSGYG